MLRIDLLLDEYYEGENQRIVKLADIYEQGDTIGVYYHLGADLSSRQTRGDRNDIQLVHGTENLAQAILHRLRTIKGELADTGHPDYGCEIYDLIGEPNTETTRARVKMMVRDALLQEPRIKEIVSINVTSRRAKLLSGEQSTQLIHTRSAGSLGGRTGIYQGSSLDDLNTVDIDILVKPIESNSLLNIGFPFSLETS